MAAGFRFLPLLLGAALAVGICADATPARASTVERIVAVVGERPLLLSELKQRARPFAVQIALSSQNEAQRNAAESTMMKELLQRMIDERLEEQAAEKANIKVTSEEIDRALSNVAEQAKISVRELVNEARRKGLNEQDYRDEIRRQLLEGKLMQLRVRGRVRVEDEDARAAYAAWLKELGSEALVDVRIIALRILPGSNAAQTAARETLADDIVSRARKGEDYCELVKAYSDDIDSRPRCGSPGAQPVTNLVPQLQSVVRALQPGQTSEPIHFGNEVILVVQLASRAKLPTFEEVKEPMLQRAMAGAMERQRKAWLQELRRGVFVEVRL